MSHLSYLEKLLDGEIVEWVALGDVTLIKTGQAVSKQAISTNPGQYPVINSGREPLGFIDNWNTDNDPIGITTRGAGVGSITWQEGKYFRGNLNYSVTIKDSANLEVRYLYHLLHQMQSAIQSLCTFDGIPALNAGSLKGLEIPIPCPNDPKKSLEIQAEIVRILDAFTAMTAELTAELNMRKKQYNYYRDQLLSFEEGDVEWKALGEIGHIVTGRTPKSSDKSAWGNDVDFVTPSDIKNGMRNIAFPSRRLSAEGAASMSKVLLPSGSLLVTCIGADMGKTVINANDCIPNQQINAITLTDDSVQVGYLFHVLTAMRETLRRQGELGGGTMPLINKSDFSKIVVPVPSYEEQNRIATILDKFDALTNSITEGLPREIELRQKQYEYYRDLLLSFPASPAGGPQSHSDEAA